MSCSPDPRRRTGFPCVAAIVYHVSFRIHRDKLVLIGIVEDRIRLQTDHANAESVLAPVANTYSATCVARRFLGSGCRGRAIPCSVRFLNRVARIAMSMADAVTTFQPVEVS